MDELSRILSEDFYSEEGRELHADKHIAKDWEDFKNSFKRGDNGFADPKYPPTLTSEEYEQLANELALSKAGTSDDRVSSIIGFEVSSRNHENRRFIKIKKTSKVVNSNNIKGNMAKEVPVSSLADCVVYSIEPDGSPVVYSMMLGFTGKLINKKLKDYIGELPENVEKMSSIEALKELNDVE